MKVRWPGTVHHYPVDISKGKDRDDIECCEAIEVHGQVIHEIGCPNQKIEVPAWQRSAWD